MSRSVKIILAVVVVLVAATTAYLLLRPDPWRPDTHTLWPPAQTFEDPEEAEGMPEGLKRPPQTEVIWDAYPQGFKRNIDRAGDRADCPALDGYLIQALDTDTPDRLALTYITRWGKHLNCPQFDTDDGVSEVE